ARTFGILVRRSFIQRNTQFSGRQDIREAALDVRREQGCRPGPLHFYWSDGVQPQSTPALTNAPTGILNLNVINEIIPIALAFCSPNNCGRSGPRCVG